MGGDECKCNYANYNDFVQRHCVNIRHNIAIFQYFAGLQGTPWPQSGIIAFTRPAKSPLHPRALPLGLGQHNANHPRQFQEILNAKSRSTGRLSNKWIERFDVRPGGWHPSALATVVNIENPVFAPVIPISHQSETAAFEGMEWVNHPKGFSRNVAMWCS
jgi:hypothetical protein